MKTKLVALSVATLAFSMLSSCVAPYYGRPSHHHHRGYSRYSGGHHHSSGSLGGYRGGGAGGGFGGSFGGFGR